MTYQIFLENQQNKFYTATAIGFPSLTVEGRSRSEALEKMRLAIRNYLQKGEVVTLDLEGQIMANEHFTFGMFKDDPDYDEFLAEVAAYREEMNQIEFEQP